MSLPSEYTLGSAIRSIDDINVYTATHPIHGKVDIYLPDKALPPQVAAIAKRHLYRIGLQLRNLSMLDVPLLDKALEVSQNPNEPYIVTGHVQQDFEQLISNGVAIRPKRMFAMLSQALTAVISLAADGWIVDRINPRQIKLAGADADQILFSIIEGSQQKIELVKDTPQEKPRKHAADRMPADPNRTMAITQKIDDSEPPEDPDQTRDLPYDPDSTIAVEGNIYDQIAEQQQTTMRQNIGILGQITFQLLFTRQFQSDDETCIQHMRELPKRWRRILARAVNEDDQQQYPTYEAILKDLTKASSRNRRAAVASVPFLVGIAVVGGYLGYERYREHKIATSEAGQAIERFLNVVSSADDTFEQLQPPAPPPPEPNEQQIMEPFEKIENLD